MMNVGMSRKGWEREEVAGGGGGGDVEWQGVWRWMKGNWRVVEKKRDLGRSVAWGNMVRKQRGML